MQDYNINQGPVKFTTLVDAPHPPNYQAPNHLGSTLPRIMEASVSNNLNPFSNSGNNSGKSLVMGLVGGALGNALYSYAMKKKIAGSVDNAAVFLLGVGLVGMISYKGINPLKWF